MKLHHSPTSPYVRKVMVVLHETGQLEEVELVPTSGTPLAPARGYASVNPLTKVPALERDDGSTLYDSRVICRYLNDRAGAKLYAEGASHWEILTLEATAEGMIDAALLMTYEARLRPEAIRFDAWIDGQWSKINNALSVLENRWMAHLKAPLNAGQIATAAALGYLDLRHDARNWRKGHDALADWFEVFSKRASMQATIPVG